MLVNPFMTFSNVSSSRPLLSLQQEMSFPIQALPYYEIWKYYQSTGNALAQVLHNLELCQATFASVMHRPRVDVAQTLSFIVQKLIVGKGKVVPEQPDYGQTWQAFCHSPDTHAPSSCQACMRASRQIATEVCNEDAITAFECWPEQAEL